MNAGQLLNYIIRPVLRDLGLWSEPAERLVLGTACQESACGQYVHQIEGPALGIYQCEAASHDDIWDNYLDFNLDLSKKVQRWYINTTNELSDELPGNLYYATAMCRIHYLRVPEPIPDTLPGQAALWKLRYNTPKGKGTVEEYIHNWRRFIPMNLV
jgi:hypothetical protein